MPESRGRGNWSPNARMKAGLTLWAASACADGSTVRKVVFETSTAKLKASVE